MRFILFTLAVMASVVTSQNPQATMDAQGTEFTIMFQENAAWNKNFQFDLQIFVTTNLDRVVNVQVSLPLIQSDKFETTLKGTVRKGNVTEFNFPQEMMCRGARKEKKGIHIVSDGPIIVYGVNPQRFSSEGFIAIPNHLLGAERSEYYTVGMPPEDQHSQLGVVGVASGSTDVIVTLPNERTLKVQYDGRTYGANDVIRVTLEQYETFQAQHRNVRRGNNEEGDMSGAKIECNKPCAAYSGNSRTSVEGRSRDLLVEQLPPLSTWGRVFAVPPTPQRPDRPDVLKIVCQQANTNVLVDGKQENCDAGESFEMKISTDAAHYVTGTKPIMVAHITMSQEGEDAVIKADPAMTLIIPEEQYAVTYTIATAKWSGAEQDGLEYDNYATVVIRQDQVDSVTIDGKNVNTEYPDTEWKIVQSTDTGGKEPLVTTNFKIESGTHTITTLNGEQPFMCIIYGAGDRESYAYMGGMRLEVINPPCTQSLMSPNDGVDNDCDARIDEEFCDERDNDGDGSIDEDCAIRNAVVGLGDKTVDVGNSVSLSWEVFAVNFANFDGLKLYKQQPTADPVMVAEGNAGLAMKEVFSSTGRYELTVSDVTKRGHLDVVEVRLKISQATLKETGVYDLLYEAESEEVRDNNTLKVNQKHQQYEIIAQQLDGSVQRAKSSDSEPRNLYFTEGGKYSLKFHSVGGMHLDELPYRLFYDAEEATAGFDVVGEVENFVTGPVPGLQDVKTVYELINREWTADVFYNQKTLSSKSSAGTTVVNAVLNVEAIVRPSIACEFKMNAGGRSGHVECDITDVTVDVDRVIWLFDEDDSVSSSTSSTRSGPYTATHTLRSGKVVAVLNGIKADQWAANTPTRVFTITFSQTNGYTVSADTPVSIGQFSAPGRPSCRVAGNVITCENVGGRPGIDSVYWLEVGGSGERINGGSTKDVWTASSLRELSTSPFKYEADLTINRNIVGREVYTVVFMRNGNEERATVTIEGQDSEPAVITGTVGETDNGDLILTANVTGGHPDADSWTWLLPDGSTLTPGGTSGNYVASAGNLNGESTVFYLTLTGGWPIDAQSYTFTVSSSSYWTARQTYKVDALAVPAIITSSHDSTDSRVTVYMNVSGGVPSITNHHWTVQTNNGPAEITAGQSREGYTAVAGENIGNGVTQFKLFINNLSYLPTNVTFTATSVVDSSTRWSSSRVHSVILSRMPPAVTCALRNTNIDFEDEAELVCTVNTRTVNNYKHTINSLLYTNLKCDGTNRNITSGETVGPFRMTEKTEGDLVEASLFFILSQDFCDLKQYKFTVVYPGGEMYVNINLHAEIIAITNRPEKEVLTTVEGRTVNMACRIQAGRGTASHTIAWKRKSLGTGRKQTIYENGNLLGAFATTGRYSVQNEVTPDNFHKSTLTIRTAQRTDAAEYECAWSSNIVHGTFAVDVIGPTLLIDSALFNGVLTSFKEGDTLDMNFEYESVTPHRYKVLVNGVDRTSSFVTTTSNGTRYDSIAQESIAAQITNQVNDAFTIPSSTVTIETFYIDDGEDKHIQMYTFTVKPVGDEITKGSELIDIKTDQKSWTTGQTITITRGQTYTLAVRINASSCSDEFKIVSKLDREVTQFFDVTRNVTDGNRCLVVYTWNNFKTSSNKNYQVIWIRHDGQIILSENPIIIEESESTTTTPAPPAGPSTTPRKFADNNTTSTTDPCSTANNGGCQHRCEALDSNTVKCSCENGYILNDDNKTCSRGINGCDILNGGCDYICNNNRGSPVCACPPGLKLSANGKSCIDDNECDDTNTCSTDEKCVNTVGSYHCIAKCECNCCDNFDYEDPGRKKRSIDENKPEKLAAEVYLYNWSPLSGSAVLAWLCSLTAAIFLLIVLTVLYNRRSQALKVTA